MIQKHLLMKRINGLLFLNSKIRFSDIYDGSSHTLLLGECYIDDKTYGWVSGTRATLRNASPPESVTQRQFGQGFTLAPKQAGDSLFVGGFESFHTGGFNCAMGDGSLKFISLTIDAGVLKKMGSRSDGELPSLDSN